LPVTFQHHTFANGLTIVCERDDQALSAAAGFFVRTGARDEATPIMGVSHFLEHMMFKGTEDLTAEELNRRFDTLGARNNAYTSNEMTCFYAHVLAERLPEAVELLGRMLRPALREKDFDTEKGVILEEIAMYMDNPFWQLYEEVIDRHYAPHPLSHRVLGTKDSIGALRADQMRAYFEDRYSADNTVLALAGRVDFDGVCAQVERLCAWWPRTGATRDPSIPRSGAGEFTMRSERVNRGYLLGVWSGPPYGDDRRYAASLLGQVLGAPDNSRLHWALIEPGIAEEAQASYDPHDGVGQFLVYASGEPSRLDAIWQAVRTQLDGLRASLAQEDLDRLLPKAVTGATVAGELPSDRMHRLGRQFTYLRRHSTLEEELERLSRVTLDDVRAVCEAFPPTPSTLGRLIPA